MVDEDARLGDESLDVDQCEQWDLFFHLSTQNHILDIVINLVFSRPILLERKFRNASIFICHDGVRLKIVVEMEQHHLVAEIFLNALFGADLKIDLLTFVYVRDFIRFRWMSILLTIFLNPLEYFLSLLFSLSMSIVLLTT